MKISLHIPPQMWQKIRYAMLKLRPNNEEVIGFIFCKKHQLNNQIRYIPKHWVIPSEDCYEYQSISGLVIKQKFHQYLLEQYLTNEKLDVVHIHTHFGKEKPHFSHVDDRYESEYSQFLADTFSHQPYLISGVCDEELQEHKFRIWNHQGTEFQTVEFSNSYFQISSNQTETLEENSLMFARQKVFGKGVQQELNQLKVALIGCGGIGSVFAETLGRLGVKNWLLIDPDHLELVNLNRTPYASVQMVEKQWLKVDYIKYLLNRIYPNQREIITQNTAIEQIGNTQKIGEYDLIVVATDNHYSRKIAQELALKYQRPLICLGTHIEVKSDGTPRIYARITIPPLGGGWCLMCGNIINLQQASLEVAPSSISNLAFNAGYINDIGDPAVLWLNNICASTAVGLILDTLPLNQRF